MLVCLPQSGSGPQTDSLSFAVLKRLSSRTQVQVKTLGMPCGTPATRATRSDSSGKMLAMSAGRTRLLTAGSCSTDQLMDTSGTGQIKEVPCFTFSKLSKNSLTLSYILLNGLSKYTVCSVLPALCLCVEFASMRVLRWWQTPASSLTPQWEEVDWESSASPRRTSSGPTCAIAATVSQVNHAAAIKKKKSLVRWQWYHFLLFLSLDTLPEDFDTHRAQQVHLVAWWQHACPGDSGSSFQHPKLRAEIKSSLCHHLFKKKGGGGTLIWSLPLTALLTSDRGHTGKNVYIETHLLFKSFMSEVLLE